MQESDQMDKFYVEKSLRIFTTHAEIDTFLNVYRKFFKRGETSQISLVPVRSAQIAARIFVINVKS
ncbi:hypothetical protein MAH1_08810 [Sessilibacter sp. MAH1]